MLFLLYRGYYTISAGETLIRALLAKPDNTIKLVGERTAGYYSDAITKILPGNLEFTMSTEWYISSDDIVRKEMEFFLTLKFRLT